MLRDDPKSPLSEWQAEKLEERESELYQKKSEAQSKLTICLITIPCGFIKSRPPLQRVVSWQQKSLDREVAKLEQEIFKIDSHTHLRCSIFCLESFTPLV